MEVLSSIFSYHNTVRLDVNYKEKNVRYTNTWRSNNTFLNSQKVADGINRQIKKCLEKKWQWKHDNSKLWDTAKAVLSEKSIAIESYLKKQEKHQIDNLILHLKQLEKEEHTHPKKKPKLVEGKKS